MFCSWNKYLTWVGSQRGFAVVPATRQQAVCEDCGALLPSHRLVNECKLNTRKAASDPIILHELRPQPMTLPFPVPRLCFI